DTVNKIIMKDEEIVTLNSSLEVRESQLKKINEDLASKTRAVSRLEKELEDKQGIFLKLKREIEEKEKRIKDTGNEIVQIKEDYNNCLLKINKYEIEIANNRESIDDLNNRILGLEKEKTQILSEKDELIEDSKSFQHRLFELQAKVIDAEIELAKAKKEQLGPIVTKGNRK
ncbi:cell division protein ZapA, partial [Clostridium butyricum]